MVVGGGAWLRSHIVASWFSIAIRVLQTPPLTFFL